MKNTEKNTEKRRRESQTSMILKRLQSGKSINWDEAIREIGCAGLRDRISKLKKQGYFFRKEWIRIANNKHILNYYLADEEIPVKKNDKRKYKKGAFRNIKEKSNSYSLLVYLLKGNEISTLKAFDLFDMRGLCSCLAKFRLLGYNIQSEWIKLDNGKRIKKYFIPKEENNS